MNLLIIRHGESEADLLDVHEGRADFELTLRGHKQAEALADFIKNNYSISKIYSSTLKRAVQTARYLSAACKVPIIFDNHLMEFNNGLLAGLSRKEAAKKYPRVPNLPVDQAVYGQESKVEFRERADKVLNTIINDAGDKDVIAIVTHGGMINQLYHSILSLPIATNLFWITGDTGIHVWKIQKEGSYILSSNLTKHAYDI